MGVCCRTALRRTVSGVASAQNIENLTDARAIPLRTTLAILNHTPYPPAEKCCGFRAALGAKSDSLLRKAIHWHDAKKVILFMAG